MHEHIQCKHNNLKYCSICDVVYCEDCKKEWKSGICIDCYYDRPDSGSTVSPIPCNFHTPSTYLKQL